MPDTAEQGGFGIGVPPDPWEPSVHAATATGKEKTTIRLGIRPVACWRLNNCRFQFGCSFVMPEARNEFGSLQSLRSQFEGAPLSVFGHADPVGDDAFNKDLSGRRALAIYGILTRDAARWERLYASPLGADSWKDSEIDTMLAAVGFPQASANRSDAIRAFQQADGTLTVDGACGPATRARLFLKYMDYLCPFVVPKSGFLGAGQDPDLKADVQGCSEFNPLLVFSQAETDAFNASADKTERDSENSVNRRVLVLLFEPGTYVPPSKWPCPRTTESTSGCLARMWSDASTRRNPQAVRRVFEDTLDTFGCRFYHRLNVDSPCECASGGKVWINIQLLDSNQMPIPNAPYKLTINGTVTDATADSKGMFTKFISPADSGGTLESSGRTYDLTFQPLPPVTELKGLQIRLNNFGYSCGAPNGAMTPETEAAIRAFQSLHGLPETGVSDSVTQNQVKQIYGS
ncbi:MAG: peptidoglycan-binding protein [Bryobacterales bacterium]|nr:peptidoglycan-binding protein [Bryobacterales bacterium]